MNESKKLTAELQERVNRLGAGDPEGHPYGSA